MSSEMELQLQQCRIFQNKDKEAVTLPYTDNADFYKTLDRYVFNGFKIKIRFLLEKLTASSSLLERIISCFNGQELINDSSSYYVNMQEILGFSSQEQFNDTLERYLQADNKIYQTYIFKYNATPEEKDILSLEPAGEGLPSYSFTVDIQITYLSLG